MQSAQNRNVAEPREMISKLQLVSKLVPAFGKKTCLIRNNRLLK
jgi:hypothetical protein